MIQALQDSFLQVRERGEDGHLSIEEQAFVGDSEIDPGATIGNTTLHRYRFLCERAPLSLRALLCCKIQSK